MSVQRIPTIYLAVQGRELGSGPHDSVYFALKAMHTVTVLHGSLGKAFDLQTPSQWKF